MTTGSDADRDGSDEIESVEQAPKDRVARERDDFPDELVIHFGLTPEQMRIFRLLHARKPRGAGITGSAAGT